MFIDDASAPFSIHSVCETTTAWGAPPGRWFEPSVMCRAFSALIEANGDLRNQIAVHVVGGQNEDDSAGGVPTIDDGELRAKSADVGKALLLFVPLVLGVGRNINTRYISQLRSIIAFKQSIGVIGGRPNASLYLVGHSDDVFFYLDPHTVQPANSFAEAVDFDSYYCSTPLQMRGELLDPTLALGFYCRDGDDLDSLFASVKALAEANATAPVLDVRSATEAKAFDARASSPSTARGRALKDDEFHDWEFL
jgi:cysteine protease ATG4